MSHGSFMGSDVRLGVLGSSQFPRRISYVSLKMLLQSAPLTPRTSYSQLPIEPAHVLQTHPFSTWKSVTQCLTFS